MTCGSVNAGAGVKSKPCAARLAKPTSFRCTRRVIQASEVFNQIKKGIDPNAPATPDRAETWTVEQMFKEYADDLSARECSDRTISDMFEHVDRYNARLETDPHLRNQPHHGIGAWCLRWRSRKRPEAPTATDIPCVKSGFTLHFVKLLT